MSMIGYARVSTSSQSTDIQTEKLRAAGCSVIRTEKVSGRSREGRTELETIMDFIQAGDVLVVAKLDRLGRSTSDVLNLVHELEERGAALKVLEPAIDTSGPMGKVVITVLGMVGEMELGFIRERQKEGIEKAKAEGRYKGRPVTLNAADLRKLSAEGVGATEIARRMKCSRSAVYKILNAEPV